MPFSLMPHVFEKHPGTNQFVVTKVMPYCRLCCDGETYFLQTGKCWTEDGKEVTKPPAWVYEQIDNMNPVVLAEIGWQKAVKGT